MTQTVTQSIHLLASSYPNYRPNPDILNIYISKLKYYPEEDVKDAVNKIVETSKFFPTFAELVDLVKAMAYNKDVRHPERYRKPQPHMYTAFDDASIAMMKERGYKSVDDFTDADVAYLNTLVAA